MKRKLLAGLLVLSMLASFLPAAPVLAAHRANDWTSAVTAAPEGYREHGDTIAISSAEGLAWLARTANQGADLAGKTILLEKSIDLGAYEWVPIGTSAHPFSATFDGQGHRITGLRQTLDADHLRAGLFGDVRTLAVKNLHLSDLVLTGQVQGVPRPSTNAHEFTDLRIGGLIATQADNTASAITVSDCSVQMQSRVTTEGGVYTTIGGIIGRTNDNNASSLSVVGTRVQLDSTTTAPEGFYYTLTGACVGEVNTTAANAVRVNDSHFALSSTASCNKSGIAKAVCTGGVIGKSDRLSTDNATNVITLSGVTAEGTHDFSATKGILATPPAAIAEIGGFFGDAQGIVMTDCYASARLSTTESAERFGNVAGYIQNARLIQAENVYTYGVVTEGATTLVNKRATHDITNATFAEACPSVYYIEPQTLTEGVAGVPFVYKSFASPSVQASDGFTYSDGDAGDAFTVTPMENAKQVAIRPASSAVPVKAEGAGFGFTLPVTVNPIGAVFYQISTVPSRWGVEITTDKPNSQAQAGELVTVTVSHPLSMKAQKLTLSLKDASLPAPQVDLLSKEDRTTSFQFVMPASDVEIRDSLSWKEHKVRLTPQVLDFGLAVEGYQAPQAQLVTAKNVGDYDEVLDLQIPSEYTVTCTKDGVTTEGFKGTLKKGESLTLSIQPKQGLSPNAYKKSIALKKGYSNLDSITCKFEVKKAQKYLLVISDNYPHLGKVEEGYISWDCSKALTLTNLGTEPLEVKLPALRYFDASFAENAHVHTTTLLPMQKATVTIHPKADLVASGGPDKDGYYYEFQDITTNDPDTTVMIAPQIAVYPSPTIVLKPTDTSGYSEGLGYDGVILEDGTIVDKTHGFAEPGFFVDLPPELKGQVKVDPNSAIGATGQHDLSGAIVLRYYREGLDAPRLWDFELYGKDGHSTSTTDPESGRYVYRAVSASGTPSPLRLQVLDRYNTPVANDSFIPTLENTQNIYTTVIPTQENGQLSAIVTMKDGSKHTCKVKLDSSKALSRGVTENVRFTRLRGLDSPSSISASEPPQGASALVPAYGEAAADTLFLMNGVLGTSAVAVRDTSGICLLNDKVLDPSVLTDYIKNNMNLSGDGFDQKYLDLVDYQNGNAILTPTKPVTIYWPLPADFDEAKPFTMVHFDLLKRTNENISDELKHNAPEIIPATLTTLDGKPCLRFEATSFSPYVLVYEKKQQVAPQPNPPVPPTPEPPLPPEEKPPVADPSDTGVAEWLDTVHHTAFLHGCDANEFRPTKAMSRAEVAAMFSNLLLVKDVPSDCTFTDVPKGAWYADAVNRLAGLGIIKGTGPQTFEPHRAITRAEFTCIAMRFARLDNTGENIFSDVSTNDWFYNEVVGAIKYGWIGGYSDGTFRPQATITRAEVTSITNRMLARRADRAFVDSNTYALLAFSDVPTSYWAYYDIVEATNGHEYTMTSNGEAWHTLSH